MDSLTNQQYWDDVWAAGEVPSVDIAQNPHQRELDVRFRRYLKPGARFLEVGVGASAWPAHVARQTGAEAWGIDFSRPGLDSAQRAADRAGVSVRLVQGDLFDGAALPARAFDLVYSGGFIEHFEDPTPVMRRLGELVRDGGVVLTTVPNLRGVNGALQKWADPEVYAKHIVHTCESLDRAHAAGGMVPVEPARYLGAMDVSSVNFSQRFVALPKPLQAVLWRSMSLSRVMANGMLRVVRKTDGGERFAPAILGIYRRE